MTTIETMKYLTKSNDYENEIIKNQPGTYAAADHARIQSTVFIHRSESRSKL